MGALQELLQKGFSLWTECSKTIKYTYLVHRLFKSHGVQINTDPRKTLIWKKTLPWELLEMFENNARTATERFSTHGREKRKTVQNQGKNDRITYGGKGKNY